MRAILFGSCEPVTTTTLWTLTRWPRRVDACCNPRCVPCPDLPRCVWRRGTTRTPRASFSTRCAPRLSRRRSGTSYAQNRWSLMPSVDPCERFSAAGDVRDVGFPAGRFRAACQALSAAAADGWRVLVAVIPTLGRNPGKEPRSPRASRARSVQDECVRPSSPKRLEEVASDPRILRLAERDVLHGPRSRAFRGSPPSALSELEWCLSASCSCCMGTSMTRHRDAVVITIEPFRIGSGPPWARYQSCAAAWFAKSEQFTPAAELDETSRAASTPTMRARIRAGATKRTHRSCTNGYMTVVRLTTRRQSEACPQRTALAACKQELTGRSRCSLAQAP